MKNLSLRIFLLFSALAILAVPSIYAQSNNEQTANIPFAFTIGDKVFPAGTYQVTRINPQSDKAALAIRSSDRRMSKIALTTPVQSATAAEKAKLVFMRYGDQYFLSQVWSPADNTGLELSKSRAERTLARSGQASETMVVALNAPRR